MSILTGFDMPTSGTALITGMDLTQDMGLIYRNMGVAPQKNVLWDSLTGRETLKFYGRCGGQILVTCRL